MFDAIHMWGSIEKYGTSASTVEEKPSTAQYRAGVLPRYTAPAIWWNWLFKHITAGVDDAIYDKKGICDEMEQLLAAAGLTPSNSDRVADQCAQSYGIITGNTTDQYDADVNNKPYMSGTTIILPDTELL